MKNQKEAAARGKNEVIFPVYSLLLKNGATGDQFAGTASTTRRSALADGAEAYATVASAERPSRSLWAKTARARRST
jgi:hypothetical protein